MSCVLLLPAFFPPLDLQAQSNASPPAGATRPQGSLEAPPAPTSVPQPIVPLLREQTAPAAAADITFTFSTLQIEGATAIDADELMAAWPHQPGTVVTVSEPFRFANAVTRIYAEAGYALSFGVVPEQTIENGVVTISVIEGFVESIAFVGDQAEVLAGSDVMRQAERIAENILDSRPLRTADLERYVLLINDLPGLEVATMLAAAPETTGASALSIVIEERHYMEAEAGYNNFLPGSLDRHTAGIWARVNGVLTGTERIRLGARRSVTPDAYWSISGDASIGLGSEGLRAGASGFYSESDPRDAFLSSLEYLGNTAYASVYTTYPLLRTRARSLVVGVSGALSNTKSEILSVPLTVDKLRTLEAFATFDFADSTLAVNYIRLGLQRGLDILGATGNSRANGDVEHTALTLVAQTDRPLFNALSGTVVARLTARGQATIGPNAAFSAAECSFGGRTFGRGFEPAVLTGDHCALGAAELRWTKLFGSEIEFDFYGFADGGLVRQKGELEAGEERDGTAASAGAGLRLLFDNHFTGMFEAGVPVSDPTSVGDLVDDIRLSASLRVRF